MFPDLSAIFHSPEDLYRCSETVSEDFTKTFLKPQIIFNKEEWIIRIKEINSTHHLHYHSGKGFTDGLICSG
jgi:hypothetical protein